MSQWLTSGRNRLLEKQKEKQRFGICTDIGDNQSPQHRDLPSAAVSSGASNDLFGSAELSKPRAVLKIGKTHSVKNSP